MIRVEAPDGTIVEFPDGTDDATIDRVMRENFAPQAPAPQAKPSLGQRIKDNLLGDDDPTTQNTGERIGAWLNKAGEAMTGGIIGDEASAALESLAPGINYADRRDHYRQQEEVLERDNRGAALAAEIAGALVAPVGAFGALGKGAGMARRMAASAGATGLMSGVYGFAEGEGLRDRMDDAQAAGTMGAGIGALLPIGGAAVQKVGDRLAQGAAVRQAVKTAPTTDQMRAIGEALYQQVDNAGVQIKPQAFSRLQAQMGQTLARQGDTLPNTGLTPKSARVAQTADEMAAQMGQQPTAALPFSSLDNLRRRAGVAAGDLGNKTDSAIGSQMVGQVDDFVDALTPSDLAAGDVQQLQSAIGKAREAWARMSRSQTVDTAIDNAENYLGGTVSGIRNQFANILRNPKLSRGFSDAEKTMMRRVINGNIGTRALQLAANGLGTQGMMLGGAALGSGAGAPGAILGGVAGGLAGRALSDVAERQAGAQAETVRALIASGAFRNGLPHANPKIAQIIEQLGRLTTAAGVQN